MSSKQAEEKLVTLTENTTVSFSFSFILKTLTLTLHDFKHYLILKLHLTHIVVSIFFLNVCNKSSKHSITLSEVASKYDHRIA